MLVCALLAVSTIVIIAAQSQQARFSIAASSSSMCGTTLPAIAFNVSITPLGELAPGALLPAGSFRLNYERNPASCPPKYGRFYWTSGSGRSRPATSTGASGCLAECWADSSQNPGSNAFCSHVRCASRMVLRPDVQPSTPMIFAHSLSFVLFWCSQRMCRISFCVFLRPTSARAIAGSVLPLTCTIRVRFQGH